MIKITDGLKPKLVVYFTCYIFLNIEKPGNIRHWINLGYALWYR